MTHDPKKAAELFLRAPVSDDAAFGVDISQIRAQLDQNREIKKDDLCALAAAAGVLVDRNEDLGS